MTRKALQIEFGGINSDNVEQLRKVNTACFPVSYNEKFYQDVVDRKDVNLNKFAYWNGFVVGAVCTRVEPFEFITTTGGGDGLNHNNNKNKDKEVVVEVGVAPTTNNNQQQQHGDNNGIKLEQRQQYPNGNHPLLLSNSLVPPPSDGTTTTSHRLYIMTLGVLAAYRGRGIGTQLIQSVLDHVTEHNQQQWQQSTSNSNTAQQQQQQYRIDQVALHVQISNHDAIRFYTTRFGFVQGEMVQNYYRRIDPPHCYLLYKNV